MSKLPSWILEMMKSIAEEILILLVLVCSQHLLAAEIQCRPYKKIDQTPVTVDRFAEGLLWKISRDDGNFGYILGTIHVDDPLILDFPPVVTTSLEHSKQFVMEVVPDDKDAIKYSNTMLFADENRLDGLLPANLYRNAVTILARYNLAEITISRLKPWAALIIMSYPPGMGSVMDLKLLEQARINQLSVSGLETMDEQIAVFGDMSLEDQLRVLVDTLCHYEDTVNDFNIMKSLYRKRDLRGMSVYSHQYVFEDNSACEKIMERLIYARNQRMVERMDALLDNGSAFFAVGAMHLPSEKGILSLLLRRNFRISRIY